MKKMDFFSGQVVDVLQTAPSSVEIFLPFFFFVLLFEENCVCYFTALLKNYLVTLRHMY